MKIYRVDHVAIDTPNLASMSDWYCRVLGLKQGYRPPFASTGAWLYADNHPLIHLTEVEQHKPCNSSINHFACSATGIDTLLNRLKCYAIDYQLYRVPDLRTLQIKLCDPEGNAMHIDFSAEEADAAGL